MSPRILEVKHCPHCRAELPKPVPRLCPTCGGSLQKRFLSAGCLTSAPRILLFVALGVLALRATRALVQGAPGRSAQRDAGRAVIANDAPDESGVAMPRRQL